MNQKKTEKDSAEELAREAIKLEQEVIPPSPELPVLEIPEIASGKIYVFLLSFYGIALFVRFFFLHGPSIFALLKQFAHPGISVPKSPSILMDCFLYMSLACQFFPLPTIPVLAFAAKVFHPVLIAFTGAVGTSIANLNDYAILGWLFRHKRVKKLRDIHAYRRLLRFFDRRPFLTLTAGAFLPIPVDVVRLVAISRAYSFWKFILAAFVGRVPRYLIIAYLGKELPAKYILVVFVISALPVVVKVGIDMIKKRRAQ